MISIGRSLIQYPIFRLTFFMAAGIFLTDTFFADVASGRCVALLWGATAILVCLFSRSRRFYRPLLYGIFLSCSAFLFGGMLALFQRQHIHYDWPSEACLYEGVVCTQPQEKKNTYAVRVDVCTFQLPDQDRPIRLSDGRNILLYLRKDSLSARLSRGETLRFTSAVSSPRAHIRQLDPDYAAYLLHNGISGTAFAERGRWSLMSVPVRLDIRQHALTLRDRLSRRFRQMHFGPDELAVLSALTIGDKSFLTPEIKSVYTASGTSHILALSGMHVGILTLILLALFRPLSHFRYGPMLRSLLVVVVLWIFAFITGLSSSVVRAVSMFTLYALASCVADEQYQSYNAVTLTAFLMLVCRPFYLFDVGFQLSFAAVYSIILFYPLLRDLFILRNPAVRYVWNVICLSLSAQLGTLPLVLFHFGAFPTYFLAANIIVAPMAFIILLLALFTMLFSVVPPLSAWLSVVLNACLHLLNTSMEWINRLYGAQLTSLHLGPLPMLTLYLLLLALYLFVRRHSARRLQFCFLALILFLLTSLSY